MLTQLHVENFALIDTLDLEFGSGLTVLTGETGAGKSIVVDAINALLGQRVGSESVREGAGKSVIQGAFDISDSPQIVDGLVEQGYDADNEVVISREIFLQGKTVSRVNGRLSSLSSHRALTQLLADVHGQHEHQILLTATWQMAFLDGFVGAEAISLRKDISSIFLAVGQVRAEYLRLSGDSRERERLADLYRFQVSEIDQAELCVGEDEQLKAESLRLANIEKLSMAAQMSLASLRGDDVVAGAGDMVAQAVKSLESIAAYDQGLEEQAVSLGEALVRIEDASDKLRDWLQTIDTSSERIDEIQHRLDVISALKRKYGDSICDILAYREKAAADLNSLETLDDRRAVLENEITQLEQTLRGLAAKLSGMRSAVIEELSASVERELCELGMSGARFLVSIETCEPGPTGADKIEFLISANAGESVKPLSRVASGGETSRIMLALKTVLRAEDPVQTIVFDEIDTGIGGRVANAVGQRLKNLASGRQIFCVTHLAQIARFADNHYCVEKSDSEGRTTIGVRRLTADERVNELARMLGGDRESEVAVHHARELLSASSTEEK